MIYVCMHVCIYDRTNNQHEYSCSSVIFFINYHNAMHDDDDDNVIQMHNYSHVLCHL